MKQNDYIIVGVAAVLGIGIAVFSAMTARPPVVPPDPQLVVTTAPALPAGSVKYTNGLPSAGGALGGKSGFSGFGGPGGGGPPGFSGKPSAGAFGARGLGGGAAGIGGKGKRGGGEGD